MIYLGHSDVEKGRIIDGYCAAHGLPRRKVVVISPKQFPLQLDGADNIDLGDVIMYVTFYRLVQEIDGDTLIVLSEVLRNQNRYDLTYNCIRNFLNRTNHHLIFQRLPQIDTAEDFMILFDFDTHSRWKRRAFDADLVRGEIEPAIRPLLPTFGRIDIPTSAKTQARYTQERDQLFATLGARDPHIIPRQLYLIGGQDKLAYIDQHGSRQLSLFEVAPPGLYVARNQRLRRDNIVPYSAVEAGKTYTVVEFPHRFLDYSDFATATGQIHSNVLVASLKVDDWYYRRYTAWSERLDATYASLS